jgi:hypothetical protein
MLTAYKKSLGVRILQCKCTCSPANKRGWTGVCAAVVMYVYLLSRQLSVCAIALSSDGMFTTVIR